MQQFKDSINKPVQGEVCVKAFGLDGKPLKDQFKIFQHPEHVKESGIVVPSEEGYLSLKDNLVVNLGRQTIAYLLGGKNFPANDWVVGKVSWGTGEIAPTFVDNTLSPQGISGQTAGGENEIYYDGVNKRKNISKVDWPSPFIVRFESVLGANEGVGYIIREYGAWTNNGTLFARKVFPGINKQSDFSLSFLHSIRC